MNYLAHIYLSGDNDLITIGNFIADEIKGSKYKTYHPEIQTGILLHRQIDSFTDAHKIFRESTKRLHKKYSHYSGIIVDILYDHFLAKNWKNYSNIPLQDYTEHFYNVLQKNFDVLPLRIQSIMPYLIRDNWLLSYASISGITKVLNGMDKRTKYRSGMDKAIYDLEIFYSEFEQEFTHFFSELIIFSTSKRLALQHR